MQWDELKLLSSIIMVLVATHSLRARRRPIRDPNT